MLTPSHAVESPYVLPYHLPRLLPAPHVPPHSNQRNSLPFVSHFIPLASALYFYPVYTATAPASSPLTSTWGFHVADAAHRGVTMPSVRPTPSMSLTLTPSLPPPHIGDST